MSQARIFVSQERLELWLSDGRASLDGERFEFAGYQFRAEVGFRFVAEVAGGKDAQALVGKVKSRSQLEPHAPEISPGAVVLGDDAYEVLDGFVLSLTGEHASDPYSAVTKLLSEP